MADDEAWDIPDEVIRQACETGKIRQIEDLSLIRTLLRQFWMARSTELWRRAYADEGERLSELHKPAVRLLDQLEQFFGTERYEVVRGLFEMDSRDIESVFQLRQNLYRFLESWSRVEQKLQRSILDSKGPEAPLALNALIVALADIYHAQGGRPSVSKTVGREEHAPFVRFVSHLLSNFPGYLVEKNSGLLDKIKRALSTRRKKGQVPTSG